MREYGKVGPTFWTGETGKKIRNAGRNAQIVALYLQTAPGSNMLGLYYLPIPVLAHETGITLEEASKALQCLSEVGFAQYDHESEYVFVPNMARFQIGERLSETDKRVAGIKKQLETLRKTPFFNQFLNLYREPYHLQDVSPSEAPQKPLRSQEQDQDHLQEQAQEQEQKVSASVVPTSRCARVEIIPALTKTEQTWDAYSQAYKHRYGEGPVRNAKVNGVLSRLVDRLGSEEAPLVAAFYLTHNNPWYVKQRHPTDSLLKDCEGLRTQWATGVKATTGEAKNIERRDDVAEQAKRVRAMFSDGGA